MGQALPFKEFKNYIENYKTKIPGCIVDTQLFVAYTYEPHNFHEDIKEIVKLLTEYEIPIFATVTTRTEFVDVMRRIIITEALMSIYSDRDAGNWSLTKAVKDILRKHRTWIDLEAKNNRLPVLSDYRIKECKESFSPIRSSGKSGWLEICNSFLGDNILKVWDILVESAKINYIDLREKEMFDLFPEGLKWKKMYSIMEETCLSASDAMIANALFSSVFPFAVTADFDLAYAAAASSSKKKVFIPTSLHTRKMRAKKFN